MRSHNYDFVPRDLAWLIAPTLAFVALAAGLLQAAILLNWLPPPRPTLDVDRTIVIHQIEASGLRQDAEVLLMGDSSCLMDLSSLKLTSEIGRPALNLGALSYLDLNAHATLLRRFVAANPNQLKAVVLLLHPEALRRPAPEQYHTAVFDHFVAGEDHVTKRNLAHWLGLEFFRTRVLSRALPTPLAGPYGRRYGFSADLESYLTRHHGSAIDPDPKPFQGNPEYRLAPQLEVQSRAFKRRFPTASNCSSQSRPFPRASRRRTMPGNTGKCWSSGASGSAQTPRWPICPPRSPTICSPAQPTSTKQAQPSLLRYSREAWRQS
jgi:hypothetical protein